MRATTAAVVDAMSPIPNLTVLELAVVIVFARRPGSEFAYVAEEIGRWFKVELLASDLMRSVQRLQEHSWLVHEGTKLHVTEDARARAERAARGIVHLAFRDRYFFDVGKLLDVTIAREDSRRDH